MGQGIGDSMGDRQTGGLALRGRVDSVVVGGGFYGCKLALALKAQGQNVVVVEREQHLMTRSSYVNQARVHNGYHYPRSLLTALRSRMNFPMFIREYPECVVDDFDKYYPIARTFSKVTGAQFKTFCDRIGSPADKAPKEIERLFNPDLIEVTWKVKEFAFDSIILRGRVMAQLDAAGVPVWFGTEARRMVPDPAEADRFTVELGAPHADRSDAAVSTRFVYNCTYARINKLLDDSGLPKIPLKHELTEMALVEVPDVLKKVGITVMCGPFFSVMPFPPRKLHSFSHVRYTPHCEWRDTPGTGDTRYRDPYGIFDAAPKDTLYPYMVRDAVRFMPILNECIHRDSIWEVKTVLPQSEVDDSRPILFKRTDSCPALVSVMGSKIDNVYDVAA
jgi:hypothetical protein